MEKEKYLIINDLGPILASIVSKIEDEKYIFSVVFTQTYYFLRGCGIGVNFSGNYAIVKEKLQDCLFTQNYNICRTEEDPLFVSKSFQALCACRNIKPYGGIEECKYEFRNEKWQQDKIKKWGNIKRSFKDIEVGRFPYLADFLMLVFNYQVKNDKSYLSVEELKQLSDLFLSEYNNREQNKTTKKLILK